MQDRCSHVDVEEVTIILSDVRLRVKLVDVSILDQVSVDDFTSLLNACGISGTYDLVSELDFLFVCYGEIMKHLCCWT